MCSVNHSLLQQAMLNIGDETIEISLETLPLRVDERTISRSRLKFMAFLVSAVLECCRLHLNYLFGVTVLHESNFIEVSKKMRVPRLDTLSIAKVDTL